MFYSSELDKRAHFGDLYELSFEEAAKHLWDGLWDHSQATQKQIHAALREAVALGELRLVRGTIHPIGEWNCNPAVLDAFEVAKWAEKRGLELKSDGAWESYMDGEGRLSIMLVDHLKALRALNKISNYKERETELKKSHGHDWATTLLLENIQLHEQIEQGETSDKPLSTRERRTLLIIIAALLRFAKIEVHKAERAGEVIARLTQEIGAPVDHQTIANKLKQVPDAIEARSK